MWLREIRETLRQTVFIMSFFALVPLLYLLDSSAFRSGWTLIDYMSNGLDLFLLISAVYLAYNLFRPEAEQGAQEYLLSLPLSRFRLLAMKITPRILVCLLLLAVAGILNALCTESGSALHSIFLNWNAGTLYLALLLIFIQLCGVILNIVGVRSWSTRLIMLLMVFLVWKSVTVSICLEEIIARTLGWESSIRFALALGRTGLALLDFAVFFLLLALILKPLYGTWDLKPVRYRERIFQRRALLPIVIFIIMLVGCLLSRHWDLRFPLLIG